MQVQMTLPSASSKVSEQQGDGAVVLVVVSESAETTFEERHARLCAVESLDRAIGTCQ